MPTFSIKAAAQLGVVGAIMLVAFLGYRHYDGLVEDKAKLQGNVATLEARIAELDTYIGS